MDRVGRTMSEPRRSSTPARPPTVAMRRAASVKLEEIKMPASAPQHIPPSETSNYKEGLGVVEDTGKEQFVSIPVDDSATSLRLTAIEESLHGIREKMDFMQESIKGLTNESNAIRITTSDVNPKKAKPWTLARANFIARRLFRILEDPCLPKKDLKALLKTTTSGYASQKQIDMLQSCIAEIKTMILAWEGLDDRSLEGCIFA